MVACNDYTSCLPDCISGMAYDLLAASARLERIAVVVEAVSTQGCSVKFSLGEKIRRAGIIFSLRWNFSGREARGKTVRISADVRHLCRHLDRHLIRHFCRHHFRHPFRTHLPPLIQTHLHTLLGTLFPDTYGDTFGDTFTDTFSATFSVSVRHLFSPPFRGSRTPVHSSNFCLKTGVQI